MKKAIFPIMILGVCVANAYASPTTYHKPYYTPSSMAQKAIRRTPQQNRSPYRGYTLNPKARTLKSTKWYIDFGLGVGYAEAVSTFDAKDWCNSAGCVSGYWDAFRYPGSNQKRNLGKETPIFASLKFARKYDKFAWGAYGDAGTPARALGLFAEIGNQWLFDFGMGLGYNDIFNKNSLDIRLSAGYAFQLSEQLSLVSTVFFDCQLADNGKAEGKGYDSENGSPCYNCWTNGTEVLTYYSGGIKATLRHKF